MAADRTPPDPTPLAERLKAYGCSAVVALDRPLETPEQLNYLDLLSRRGAPALVEGLLSAVAEHQGTALLYVIDADDLHPVPAAHLTKLQRTLANRSDPAWLAVCTPGSLHIHPIGFRAEDTTTSFKTINASQPDAPLFFQSLVHCTFAEKERLQGTDFVFREIFRLLEQTIEAFVPKEKLAPLDILSMAGRALLFRFLIDRKIVLPKETEAICPAAGSENLRDAFSSPEKAAQTSAWLDETFNGDFLPLIDESVPAEDRTGREQSYLRFYRSAGRDTGGDIFRHLRAILNGWHATGDGHQTAFDWDDFDFAHIPVGVLSQVYESFCFRVDEAGARASSTHYTPRLIAELMVSQTFAALPEVQRSEALVLDPACGAGIFLVLAFRRLVRERWQHTGVRPDTRTIQRILYQQLRGFELSEAALRLATLSLYITAIEVNGTQRPPKALKFPANLRDSVLFNVSEKVDRNVGFSLESLRPRAPADLDGSFDIVIGNPPWTRLRDKETQNTAGSGRRGLRSETAAHNDVFTKIGSRVLRARGFPELGENYKNPDKNPDLPFLWRATEWAKPDGLIALALPGRVFGRTSGSGFRAWQAILRSIHVNGLINGADLRWSSVWKGIKEPFSVLFARNAVPPVNHRFYFSAPVNDARPNELGRFRIDYEATQTVSVERVLRLPWVLKTLSLGTWRDVEVMETICAAFPQSLDDAWATWNPTEDKTGQGYNLSSGLTSKAAPWLRSLLDFEPSGESFSIQYENLRTFERNHGRASAHMPRTASLYQSPLVIIPKAPGEQTQTPKAYIARQPLAFSQSFYGYSCAGHPESAAFASLLYLIPHSVLFQYFSVMISVTQGADRMIFTKQDLDALSFPEVSALSPTTKETLKKLAYRLEHDSRKPWGELNAFLFDLYRLDDDAQQTIYDTLFSAAVYRRQGRVALERTTRASRATFLQTLRDLLAPYFEVCGRHVAVEEAAPQPDAWEHPWHFITISQQGEPVAVNAGLLRCAMQEANKTAASRIIVRAPDGKGLLLGLLNQKRWWTISRARLYGRHLLREHLGVFGLSDAA